MYLVQYTNSTGKVITKEVAADKLAAWVARLDRWIEKGYCGGYLITALGR